MSGKWVIPPQNTTQQRAQASLQNRSVRERLFVASTLSYAAYSLDDNMASG
jgi:peptidyl-dipeptidase Dcp